jgi:hypothetical protein
MEVGLQGRASWMYKLAPKQSIQVFQVARMTTSLANFLFHHPTLTLSYTDYGRDFLLGPGVNISSSPTQRLQSFVARGGTTFRVVVVGQLTSFKVVEDPVRPENVDGYLYLTLSNMEFGHYVSVSIGQPSLPPPSRLVDVYQGQLTTLENIEEEDRADDRGVEAQVFILLILLLLFILRSG